MNSVIKTTNRLILEPFKKSEVTLFLKINTDSFVRKFLWDDEIIPTALAQEILEQNAIQFKNEQCGLWKVLRKRDRAVIGYTGLWYFFDEPQPQLLYALLPRFIGLGYAHEAASIIVEYAFEVLNFKYLNAACDLPNVASQKVALKLGMYQSKTIQIEGKSTLFFTLEKA
jgi:ribosomal-protein-alanine N-acetyltransferase